MLLSVDSNLAKAECVALCADRQFIDFTRASEFV